MTNLAVWAPNAKLVELHYNQHQFPMTRESNGWWTTELTLSHGEDYGYLVNQQGPFPDPRSRWQPYGAHGLSRVLEPTYAWQDSAWRGVPAGNSVIYELHVGTFTEAGTFTGVIEKLDYLKQLGVTHIELLPVAEFSGEHGWGYDGVQLFAAHHTYGGPLALKQLVDACHQQGLGIILDVVYNHLGPSGNYLKQFAPYFHKNYHTPWGEAVNVDGYDSPEVRQYFIDNALMWLDEFHFDGLRLDAVQTIMDGSAIHFLEQLARDVKRLEEQVQRPLLLIAESHMNDKRLMRQLELGGYGLQAQWHDDFHHSVYAYLTGERAGYFQDYGSLAHLAKVLNQGVYFDGQYCQYRRRLLGGPIDGLTGHNFVAYIQNHDQVGNRPGGERLSHLLHLGQLKIAAALLLTSPFIPMLFQGEEWGSQTPFYYFTDHDENHLSEAIRRGRQDEAKAFGWPLTGFSDPQERHSFQRSQLQWAELEQADAQEMLAWYQSLLKLRHAHAELRDGTLIDQCATFDEAGQWLWVTRGRFDLVCNFAAQSQTIAAKGKGERQCRLSSHANLEIRDGAIDLPPHSVVLMERIGG